VDDKRRIFIYFGRMDEAHTGLGLLFLLAAFALCGGIVIWLIVSEGIRHSRTASHESHSSSQSH
jgi:hypothetical protein